MTVTPIPNEAHAPSHRPRWPRSLPYLLALGPGLIAANAGNDAGGILTYASAGAQYRYRTLFLMVVVTVALVLVQEMCARLSTYTGKGLAALIREEFPLRVAAFALVCLLVANVGLVVSEFAGIGAALELLGVNRILSIPLAAVGLWTLVMFGSYRYAERLFLVLSLVFFAYPVAAILAGPNWADVGKQTVIPHLLASPSFLFLAVALIGTTVTPYMQLYVAAAVADKGAGPDDYPLVRFDTVAGAVFACVISMAIIVASGAALGGQGPLDSTKQAATALRPVAGRTATTLFGVGLFGASALAAAVVPLSTSYAIAEALGVERSVSRRFSEARLFLGLFSAQIALGAIVALSSQNLVALLINAQVLNGMITPVILVFVLVLANRRSVLGEAANGRWFRGAAAVCVAGVSVLSLIVLVQTVAGWTS